ncbi:uncharacterized protein TOL2_C14310 [Desulfobacula toluolica Tol2]|uniref:Uncharacterized protein n=1 Tax=Desulfobacula toluolica (strain DSM 7467 / Tol2) TaxID=651182 RepID=K0N6I3_DESTT|nr:uncharacterized protein TOL2_C14310 [Desulfobacula toluolica Tol2]
MSMDYRDRSHVCFLITVKVIHLANQEDVVIYHRGFQNGNQFIFLKGDTIIKQSYKFNDLALMGLINSLQKIISKIRTKEGIGCLTREKSLA